MAKSGEQEPDPEFDVIEESIAAQFKKKLNAAHAAGWDLVSAHVLPYSPGPNTTSSRQYTFFALIRRRRGA